MAQISAAGLARVHTLFAASSFISALILGSALHFHKIVKNSVAQYPDEWFPSVSATIGDWYPERNIFQILIALTSGPRFALVFLQYFLHHSTSSCLPTIVFISGIVRTLSCGGWVYITSSEDHDVHDFMMILYIVCNIPWMLLGIATTPISRPSVLKKRKLIAGAFFATIAPLIYFFVQHKIYKIPGAYTRYAFFEWGLIFFDILYDSIVEQEFKEAGLQISLVLPSTTASLIGKESIQNENSVSTVPLPVSQDKITSDVFKAEEASGTVDDPALNRKLSADNPTPNFTSFRHSVSFLGDVYLAYIFWSLFTSLIPTLFYFSVWKLGIAGHELALLSVLSPILLSLSSPYNYFFANSAKSVSTFSVLQYTKTRQGQTTFHTIALIGLIAYLVPSPGGRLVLVALCNIVAVMRQSVAWSGIIENQTNVGYQSLVTGLGIIMSSVSKQANRSNNPVWPFINHKAGGYNKTGLFLAAISIYEYSTAKPSVSPPTQPKSPSSTKNSSYRPRSSVVGALPLGSLLFSLHNYLAESSTLIAWSWTGYKNGRPNGPVPHIHGSLTIGAMSLGLLFALWSLANKNNRNLLSHPVWFVFGAASTYILYTYRNWLGYLGGLAFALFHVSILPLVFQTASDAAGVGSSAIKIAKTYTIAMAVYCLLNLASVFTVAYAFVPGGIYLRERVMILQMSCLVPVFQWANWSSPSRPDVPLLTPKTKSHICSLVILFLILSLLTTFNRLPGSPQTFKPGTRIFNAGIWTVHFGIDNEGHDSQLGIMNVIRDMELDIVGLLETDLHRTAFGHRDLSRLIVEQMNYNVDIGPGPNSHTWGAALLSKFPIISTKHHLLPSPQGELAPAIEAILDVYGTEVLVLVAHNGQEEDALDRELQSTELAKIMASSSRPVIFLGYVVTKPGMSRPDPYGIMVEEGHVHDIDMDDKDRWCEYIFYRGLYRTSYARISRGIITDTETQIGQFVLPRHGHRLTNDTVTERYIRSRKEELPVEHWFPMEYYGNEEAGGVNGHYYHVFNTPLYYKIPEDALL